MHNRRVNEKPNNFKLAFNNLFINLGKFRKFIFIALVLAFISSIISLIAPNQLSKITDEITINLGPKQDKIMLVNKELITLNNDNIKSIINSDKYSIEKIDNFKLVINNPNIKSISNLDNDILIDLYKDTKLDNKEISSKDIVKTVHVFSNLDPNNYDKYLKDLDNLPSDVLNIIRPKMNKNKIHSIALLLLILYIISSLISYSNNFILATVSNKFSESLRNKIIKKISRLPLKYYDNALLGDVLSRVTNDVDSMNQNLNQSLLTFITNITLFFGSIIMMFYTNYIMAITGILSSIIGFVFMIILLRKSQKYFNQKQKELGKLNSHIEEVYSGHNIVKVYNGVDNAKEEFDKLNNNLYKDNLKSQFLSGLMPSIMAFIGNFGFVMVCIVGGILTLNDMISFGVIVAFMIYIRLFTNPLSQIAQALAGIQSTLAASDRVFEFLSLEEMPKEDNKTKRLEYKDVKGDIEFKHVDFSYNKDNKIINDFNAKINRGMKVAIVGKTGAGKTTIINLLMRFYEIDSGEILIDNIKSSELTKENIHELFTMVLQDTWLFKGTIRENLVFNNPNITDKEILKILDVVGIKHFINTLPNGLDHVIDDTDSISQGEKQLLTIARAMLNNKPFLILDEATSNVDTRTEELVSRAMDKLAKGKTSFIIAHRLSTIKNADLILVVDKGNIIEKGNHEELLKKDGYYAKLYNSQFTYSK